MSSRRVAAIDCGTNSIRLLVADLSSTGGLTDVVREMRVVRLGEGVDRTGTLSAAALERTWSAVDEYAALVASLGCDATRFVATSATRDASNRDDFVAGVRERLGVVPEVLSGDEEASLSFLGARSALAAETPTPWLVVDIGGGSTECVMGAAAGIMAARSVDIGCVRITERCLSDDPPTASQIQEATAAIDEALALADAVVDLRAAKSVVGLAGSVTTVAAIDLELAEYDADAIHGHIMAAGRVHEISLQLLKNTRAERAAIPSMHPGRVDVIGAGALILDRIMVASGAREVVVSEHDILDGIALSMG